MTAFATSVRRHFDFLIDDFGFAPASDDSGVRYDADKLYVLIGQGQGEIDLAFVVKVDTEAIRPYMSHMFSLDRVVRYFKDGPFPVFASFPAVPGVTEEERYLVYLAALTKRYCKDILRGDITPLERLTTNPGAKHG